MITGKTILETNDLSVGYGKGVAGLVVLPALNLSLRKGELTCLTGPNGVGKSTLLRTLSGVQKPLAGGINLKNKPLNNYDRTELAREISLVLTETPVSGSLSVYDIIALGRYPHTDWTGTLKPVDEKRIREAIEETHCGELANRRIHELSDGQRQKVMIARALAQDSDLMILDEPTAHLDLNNKVEIMKLLQKLAREKQKSILAATHELDLAMQTADRLWIAGFSHMVIEGAPEDLALNGLLAESLDMKGFTFDPASGKIILENPARGKVKLTGKSSRLFWTRHALERIGIAISENAARQVEANGDEWLFRHGDQEYRFSSIGELVQYLKQV